MPLNNSRQDIIAKRREDVSRFRLRGWTQRQIAEMLNVSVGTVNRDLACLQEEWKAAALASIDEHKTRVLAELAEVKRRGHADGNLNVVVQALKTEIDILGLDAPAKSEIKVEDAGLTDAERADRIAAILDKARARRFGSDDSQQYVS